MLNGEIHNWYKSVFGAPPSLISTLIEDLGVKGTSVVFDPFCGTGTTNVECKARTIGSIGTDANPVAILASRVKTTWNLDSAIIAATSIKVLRQARRVYNRVVGTLRKSLSSPEDLRKTALEGDPTYQYLEKFGMLDRGWINVDPLARLLAMKQAILRDDMAAHYKDLFMLALIQTVKGVSNIRFGPELYCHPRQSIPCAFSVFQELVEKMLGDLNSASETQIKTPSHIFEGDARDLSIFRNGHFIPNPDFVITSPPYPTEHDYTRNTRLELAFLEAVVDLQSLRKIKKAMIRSNSKSIYNNDNDGKYVTNIYSIKRLVQRVEKETKNKTYAFAKMYPLIVSEYFGGMFRHFLALSSVLNRGAKCAYIVGDQSSYVGVHISTAKLLADIIQKNDMGLTVDRIDKFRDRRGTTGSGRNIAERILFFSKKG
jgi:hypothetical protein